MKKQFAIFILRWILNSVGLWIASRLFGGSFDDTNATATTFLLAGLVLSLVNTLLKPIIVILSLPAILLTLGFFILIINGFMVYVALKFVPGLDISFGASILTGIIISLINYIISGIIDLNKSRERNLA